jgi:hypothetical protein
MRARTASAARRSGRWVLAELQEGDQRQPPRRQSRPAEPGEQVGEVGVGKDGAELVAQLEERVALAEGGPGDTRGLLGHWMDRVGPERHGGPPRQDEPAAGYPDTPHLSSADFANGI